MLLREWCNNYILYMFITFCFNKGCLQSNEIYVERWKEGINTQFWEVDRIESVEYFQSLPLCRVRSLYIGTKYALLRWNWHPSLRVRNFIRVFNFLCFCFMFYIRLCFYVIKIAKQTLAYRSVFRSLRCMFRWIW